PPPRSLPPAPDGPPALARPSPAAAGHPAQSPSTTARVVFCRPNQSLPPLSGCCQSSDLSLAAPPTLLPSPLPLPPTGRPAVRSLPRADCRCPSPPPCPRSVWCPRPPGSCDSAGSPPAAPPRSTSSAGPPPSYELPAWPRTPAARSSASALLPSPTPAPPSSA